MYMNLKKFINPTKFKLILVVLVFLEVFAYLYAQNLSSAIVGLLGYSNPSVLEAFAGLNLIIVLPALIVTYVLLCLIEFLYNKYKK